MNSKSCFIEKNQSTVDNPLDWEIRDSINDQNLDGKKGHHRRAQRQKNYKKILQTTFVNRLDKLDEMRTFLERQIAKLD